MAEFDRNSVRYGVQTGARAGTHIDEGLRSYMLRVYNYMTLGLLITGFAALGTFLLATTNDPASAAAQLNNGQFLTSIGVALYSSPLKWVVMLAPLGVVFLFSARINSMSVSSAQGVFWLFAALMGISLSSILLVFTGESIVRVFFITSAAFGGLSLWAYTTKKDLSGWGSFLIMGVIGLIIASLVNIFIASSALQWAISVIGVLVFSGLTAYDTQRIKQMYYVGDDSDTAGRKAISGALALYLDFINMFVFMLQMFGNRQ